MSLGLMLIENLSVLQPERRNSTLVNKQSPRQKNFKHKIEERVLVCQKRWRDLIGLFG